MGDVKDQIDGAEYSMPSFKQEEGVVKIKYGGIIPKKPPLIFEDHVCAYFDSADWDLGKQGIEKPKGPLKALRPKFLTTQQQSRYHKSPCAPSEVEGVFLSVLPIQFGP
ncbi:uncharacterized protein LOC107032651 [Solanum pennellii]|uniref:Uncharacterized protein LOC107032651 n=1 Tax=Solanum pennellii TaxID=28526 RepID=A0ABM1HSL2_SOLPN|nr:uncharacterized protein LOC107032651 [Solanum pennellii]